MWTSLWAGAKTWASPSLPFECRVPHEITALRIGGACEPEVLKSMRFALTCSCSGALIYGFRVNMLWANSACPGCEIGIEWESRNWRACASVGSILRCRRHQWCCLLAHLFRVLAMELVGTKFFPRGGAMGADGGREGLRVRESGKGRGRWGFWEQERRLTETWEAIDWWMWCAVCLALQERTSRTLGGGLSLEVLQFWVGFMWRRQSPCRSEHWASTMWLQRPCVFCSRSISHGSLALGRRYLSL